MMGWLKRRRLERRRAERMPARSQFLRLVNQFPALAGLNEDELERLRHLAACVLAEKEFIGGSGLEPDYAQCLMVAIHAALPALNLGTGIYTNFATFILYPDEFLVDVDETDESGVVHRGRDLRAGEAWLHGPVVLSLTDVAQSGQGQGFNVVIHELAHQLDQLSGDADGFPPLPKTIAAGDWTLAYTTAYDRLQQTLEDGVEPFLDPYAAESPAEFFAVSCEFFFDAPAWLNEQLPEIYELLTRFFRQDPARRLNLHQAARRG